MAPRAGWKKVAATVTLTATSFTYSATAAQAFFPPWWPTTPSISVSPPPVPPQIVPPVPPPPFVPPVSPPPAIVPPVCPPPAVVPPTCPNTCGVPEPSTLTAGVAGMVAAAGWAARRRRVAG